MAALGFEQQRVLLQLQCSGILEMVRIRRQGFPSRMPFREFEMRFAPLLIENTAEGGAGGMRAAFKRMVTRPEERGEGDQAAAEAAESKKAGTANCLIIMKRANLFEHRHYQFGKVRDPVRDPRVGSVSGAECSECVWGGSLIPSHP